MKHQMVLALAALVSILVIGLTPLGVVVALSLPVLPISWANVVRTAALIWLALLVSYSGVVLLARVDGTRACMAVDVFLVLSILYPLIMAGVPMGPVPPAAFAVLYMAAAVVVSGRMLRLREADTKLALSVALLLTFLLVLGGLGSVASSLSAAAAQSGLASSLVFDAGIVNRTSRSQPRPDIYHLVLDGMGRPDVLDAAYGIHGELLAERLSREGFAVNWSGGAANYCQTYLSLASMLNMTYLDPLAALGDTPSMAAPQRLIEESIVFRQLKKLGYQIHYYSPWLPVSGSRHIDECDCSQPVISQFDSLVLAQTPFRDLPIWRLVHRIHANRILQQLDRLSQIQPAQRPRFVFAHVLSPHPPFVLTREGGVKPPARWFTVQDGDRFGGTESEYKAGYRAQVEYLSTRIPGIVQRFRTASAAAGREAVIFVTGDHGPRLHFSTDPVECFPTLIAERWPVTVARQTAPTDSLVNLYRRLFRTSFGLELKPLESRFMLSSFTTPYQWQSVPRSIVQRD